MASRARMNASVLPSVRLGLTQRDTSAIGLGCSRLGSTLNGGSRADALGLIRHALDRGVCLFDTADIYGQGDSERLLGEALGPVRDDVVVVTKAGQRFTSVQRVAALLKKPIRAAAMLLPSVKQAVAGRRAGRLPRDFSPDYLEQAIGRSLKRLRRERIDVFLLHSPNSQELRDARCLERLTRLQEKGQLRHWGISCDDRSAIEAALAMPDVPILQIPFLECTPELVARLQARQIGLLVREVFAEPPVQIPSEWRRMRVEQALLLPNAAALVGTTRSAHLDQTLNAAVQAHATVSL